LKFGTLKGELLAVQHDVVVNVHSADLVDRVIRQARTVN
jgi:hypothetical protein